MTDGACGTPYRDEEGKTLTESIVNDQTGSDPQLTPQQQAVAWNLRHPVGTPVTLRAASGVRWPTTTRSPAHVHAGRAVLCVAHWPGAHPLDEITPIPSDVLGGAA